MPPPVKRFKFSRSDRPNEISFDPAARQEYLTGFHKRKQARIQNARDTAAKRDKEAKVLERKQLRERRKEDLQKHVEEVNLELKKQMNPDGMSDDSDMDGAEGDDKFEGFEDAKPEVAQDEEYVDEDKYTTVTVEAMDDSKSEEEEEHEAQRLAKAKESESKAKAVVKKKRPWAKDGDKPKPKMKKFRYESKAERAATRAKQKTKNKAAKERRVGKA